MNLKKDNEIQTNYFNSLKVGDIVTGKVIYNVSYGTFIQISNNVKGLIHISEMIWINQKKSNQKLLSVGGKVDAKIISIDFEKGKIGLSIKQLKYSIGSKHQAKVSSFTKNGIICELEKNIKGFIHITNLTFNKKTNLPADYYFKLGDNIDVVVLEMNNSNRLIVLGHKQLKNNPWDEHEDTYKEGSIHFGTIIRMKQKTGIVSLPHGIVGICPEKFLKKQDGTTAQIGEFLKFKVIEFNKSKNKLIIEHLHN